MTKALSIGLITAVLGAMLFTGFKTNPEPLKGEWVLVSSQAVGPDGDVVGKGVPQESLLMFSDTHYSMNWARGEKPSPYYAKHFAPTDEEKLARYAALVINAGTYEVDGDQLVIHPTFALVPEFVGGKGVFTYSVDGDTLSLDWTGIEAADGTHDPWTEQGYHYQYKWVRD